VQSFQRARSAEQREARRAAILATAHEMLAEMPVSQVTMNGLARRVGLAKSNVMRYFESREAVLLDLLARMAGEWLTEATARVHQATPQGSGSERAHGLARLFAAQFAEYQVLCDLLSAEASVLEHNVSEEVALRYKRGATDGIDGLAALIADVLPELDADAAHDAAFTTIVLVGAMWTHSHPSPAMAAVYRDEPALATVQGFTEALGEMLATYFIGLLTR
jgi:AcrR family transcriptional regulator